MSGQQSRVKCYVDVDEETNQLANVAADLKPPQLVAAILEEFHAQEQLGDNPAHYYLLNKETRQPLDDTATLGFQVHDLDRLALVERELPLPEGAMRPSRPVYLREIRTPRTFPVQWLPAIIGRQSEHQPHNELVAVDLRSYAAGLRVSRRHVRLTEQDGAFYIDNLSDNPVWLVSPGAAAPLAVGGQSVRIAAGDVIRLERSEIEFKLIVRNPPAQLEAPEAAPAAEPEPAASGAAVDSVGQGA